MTVRWEDRALGAPLQLRRDEGVAIVDVSVETEQVWAEGPTFDAVARLDALADYPNVTSVVGGRVATERLLPQITELLVRKSDATSLHLLPNVEQLIVGFDRSDRMDLGDLPDTLVDLALLACARKETVANLPGIERLVIGWVEDAAQVSSLERLRWLSISPGRGLHRLGRLGRLELVRLGLDGLRPKSLAPLAEWAHVTDVAIGDAGGLQSLDGVEGWTKLRRLALRGAGVPTLQPLAGLPLLEEVQIEHPAAGCDLAALGTLPVLRRLQIFGLRNLDGTFELDSIDFLRGVSTLESVDLAGVHIRDADLSPLRELPALRHVVVSGDYGSQVDELREKLGAAAVEHGPLHGWAGHQ